MMVSWQGLKRAFSVYKQGLVDVYLLVKHLNLQMIAVCFNLSFTQVPTFLLGGVQWTWRVTEAMQDMYLGIED